MPNNLILGSSGFIGTNLALYLLQRDEPIRLIDVSPPRELDLLNYHRTFDARDSILLQPHLEWADIVYYCVGQTSHPDSIKHPDVDLELNCGALLKVLQTYQKLQAMPLLVYLSSTSVYGAQIGIINEKTIPGPPDIYSTHKLTAEFYLKIFHRIAGIPTVILRLPNCYGPYGNPLPKYGFINHFIAQAQENSLIQVYGKGKQHRNLLYIQDALEAVRLAIKMKDWLPITFNVVSRHHYSINDVASIIGEIWRCDDNIEYIDWPNLRQKIELGDVVLESLFFGSLIGWREKYTLESGLQETYEIINNRGSRTHR